MPVLGANINPAGCALKAWIVPSLILNIDGVKVGLFCGIAIRVVRVDDRSSGPPN